MRDLLDYPLGAVRSALRTIAGWTAVMAITSIGGFVVARGIVAGDRAPFPCFCLPVLGALMATALGWTLGLYVESFRFRLLAAVVNTALWAAVGVWARLPYD